MQETQNENSRGFHTGSQRKKRNRDQLLNKQLAQQARYADQKHKQQTREIVKVRYKDTSFFERTMKYMSKQISPQLINDVEDIMITRYNKCIDVLERSDSGTQENTDELLIKLELEFEAASKKQMDVRTALMGDNQH
jgi:HD-GYP domain-containing protein (c-di-GMP phosphodiesterase class II)